MVTHHMNLDDLAALISKRRNETAQNSYTASLLHKGVEACAKKFGEEAFELAMASVLTQKTHIRNEAADVIFHLLVLLESVDVPWSDVMAELTKRQQQSGHAEKAARGEKK